MLCLDAPQNGSLCSASNQLCSHYARIIRHMAKQSNVPLRIRVCGLAKDLVEPPEASSPEFYPLLKTVVSGRLPNVLLLYNRALR